MSDKITVYRIVWNRAGLTMRSDWSVHYDVVLEFHEEKRREMPGTEPRIEQGSVDSVEIEEHSVLDKEEVAAVELGEPGLEVTSRENYSNPEETHE